jgi:hypothetical protein
MNKPLLRKVAKRIEYPNTMHFVFRNGKPYAAFIQRGMAEGFVKEFEHRANDTIAARRISFACAPNQDGGVK